MSIIIQPVQFFSKLGGLHDTQILNISWDIPLRKVSLRLDDLNANFEGLSDYQGLRASTLVLNGVSDTNIACQTFVGDRHTIYELSVIEHLESNSFRLLFLLSPGGKIELSCESLELID